MSDALRALNNGDLEGAIKRATEDVRAAPADPQTRYVLAELLCFQGDFERADAQLDTAASLNPQLAVNIAQFRQVIRGEVARQDCYASGRPPDFLVPASPGETERLRGIMELRAGATTAAAERFSAAEVRRGARAGTADGAAFGDWRDADDRCASVLEMITSDGRFFWVPWTAVISIVFERQTRARDVLFREARLVTADGTDGVVFVPTLYAGSFRATSTALRLGRETDWGEDASCAIGIGHRIWFADDRDLPALHVQRVEFAAGTAP